MKDKEHQQGMMRKSMFEYSRDAVGTSNKCQKVSNKCEQGSIPVLQQIMKYRAGDNLGALELWAVRNDAGLAVVDLAREVF